MQLPCRTRKASGFFHRNKSPQESGIEVHCD
jgi:hypothetical protein